MGGLLRRERGEEGWGGSGGGEGREEGWGWRGHAHFFYCGHHWVFSTLFYVNVARTTHSIQTREVSILWGANLTSSTCISLFLPTDLLSQSWAWSSMWDSPPAPSPAGQTLRRATATTTTLDCREQIQRWWWRCIRGWRAIAGRPLPLPQLCPPSEWPQIQAQEGER